MVRIFMVGYSENKGGVESYIKNLNDNLDNSQFEVIYTMPEMMIDGRRWIRPANRHNYLKYRLFWRKFYKKNSIDVLYFNTCDIVSIDQLRFAKRAKIPIRIIHSHNTELQQKLRFFHRYTEKHNRYHINDYATHLFACSAEAGEWMFGGHAFTVIKNGIDISKYQYSIAFREECRSIINAENCTVVGCLGRLDPQKNPLFALEIMKAVKKQDDNVKFVFIGDGELREKLDAEILNCHMENCVYPVGARDDANKWYSALDCLLMPSLFEGLPFTLVEAQAAGLPCVVSSEVSEEANLTGLVEYISLDESKEVWAERILKACRKPRIDTTHKLIDAGYSIEDTAKKVSDIILNSLDRE